MLVNKVNRLINLINKDEEYNTFSKNEKHSITRNQFYFNIFDNNIEKIEKDFNKKNLNIRRSINYTIQSFKLIKCSTGSKLFTIQDSRDPVCNGDYQSELENLHKDFQTFDYNHDKLPNMREKTKLARNKFSKMKPILSNVDLKKFELEKCNENLTEWNKFKLKQTLYNGGINLKKFKFADRNLYNSYLNSLDERDAIIAAKSLKNIQTKIYRQKDPIFLKQHNELMKARACNKPPIFLSLPMIKPGISKPLISKLKQELINEFNLRPYEDQKLKITNFELADRVKQFLRNS